MNLIILFLLTVISLPLMAANPAFTDFNTNQYATVANKVVVKSGALLTNTVITSGTNYGSVGRTNLTWTDSSGWHSTNTSAAGQGVDIQGGQVVIGGGGTNTTQLTVGGSSLVIGTNGSVGIGGTNNPASNLTIYDTLGLGANPQIRLTVLGQAEYTDIRSDSTGGGDLFFDTTGSTVWLRPQTVGFRSTLSLNPKGEAEGGRPANIELFGNDYYAVGGGTNWERLAIFARGTNVANHGIIAERMGTGLLRPLQLAVEGSTGIWLATNGNVGIGTINPTTPLRVNGIAAFDANVGIGTPSPGYKLTVAATQATGQSVVNIPPDLNQLSVGMFLNSPSQSGAVVSGGASSDGSVWTARTSGSTASIIHQTGGVITLYTDAGLVNGNTFTPSARVTVLNTGNVGIGTTGPLNKLDVAGGAVIGSGYAGIVTAPANGLAVQGNVGIGGIFYGNGAGLTNLYFILLTNGYGMHTTLYNSASNSYFTNSNEGFAIGMAPQANYSLSLVDGVYIQPNAFGVSIDGTSGSISGLRFQAATGDTFGDAGYWNMYGEALGSITFTALNARSVTNMAFGIADATNASIGFIAGNPPTVIFQNRTNGPENVVVGGSLNPTNGVLWQGGAQLTNIYTATATLDFGNVATIGCGDLTITVAGAALGDVVDLGVPNASVVANSSYSAWVSSADTVTVRFCALISGDPASGVFRAEVHKWK